MAYATLDDMAERYGARRLADLTDRAEPPAGLPDPAVIGRALADATAEIDGRIGARYQLPLATVPLVLADLTLRLAYLRLFVDGAPDAVLADGRDARAYLDRLADGRAVLDIGAGPAAPVASGIGIAPGPSTIRDQLKAPGGFLT